MQRRDFLRSVALGTGAVVSGTLSGCTRGLTIGRQVMGKPISRSEKPLAIAMWDTSWLLRHHKGGEFEDWDKVLDELAGRGYNAIRIDALPHLVAADPQGKTEQEFYFPRETWEPALWGNYFSTHARPREALMTFLPKCRQRGISVGLATWFTYDGSKRNDRIQGLDEFVRVWDETLTFLAENRLLDGVVYVDVLNEYPQSHGLHWLTKKLRTLANPPTSGPETGKPQTGPGGYNQVQRECYREFMTQTLKRLKNKWPAMDFFASLPASPQAPWQQMDLTQFGALDVHMWFVFNDKLDQQVGYFKNFHKAKNDLGFEQCYAAIREYWQAHKHELVEWMEGKVQSVAQVGKQYGIPYGNTEGWGPVRWLDHPALDWNWVKETGEIGARLGAKHGYKFNCSSNFTHPQFRGLWADVAWHREITSIIRRV